MEPTVGCITRMCYVELPYIKCFIDHYLSIGVNRIYIVNTSISKEKEIKNYLSKYGNKILIKNLEGTKITKSQNQLLKYVKETYTLTVDVDEFLNINPPNKIQNIMNPKFNYYRFRWIMCPNDSYKTDKKSIARGFKGHAFKPMAKTNLIKRIEEHAIVLKPGTRKNTKKMLLLIHYWSRDFNDVLLKCFYNEFKKGKSYDGVLKDINDGILPPRLKLLAMLTKCKHGRQFKKNHIRVDYKMEEKLMDSIDPEIINKLRKIYLNYKNKLNKKYPKKYPNKSLENFVKILPNKL